jgi:hypothetical protein
MLLVFIIILYQILKMLTRSQTKSLLKKTEQKYEETPLLKVEIDFDEASAAWKANKKSIGNGSYKYICCADKNGKKCGVACVIGELYCRSHCKSLRK